jgi:chromosome segregation ATPase
LEREAHNQTKRERDEAQYKLEDARQSLEVALEDLSEAKRERDEAREECRRLIDVGVNGAGARCFAEIQRERDEARGLAEQRLEAGGGIRKEREEIWNLLVEAREQNAKLRDIAERLFAAGVGRMKTDDWRTLRAELDQLK